LSSLGASENAVYVAWARPRWKSRLTNDNAMKG